MIKEINIQYFLQLLVEINGYEFMPNKMIFSRMKNAEKKFKSAVSLDDS